MLSREVAPALIQWRAKWNDILQIFVVPGDVWSDIPHKSKSVF